MPTQTRTVAPGPTDRTVRTAEGQVLAVPADWVLIPPGDPGLTRRVKAAGPTWTVQEKKGRKLFGRGVWTAPAPVAAIRAALSAERADPAYAKKQAAAAARRDREQTAYVGEFRDAVLAYLAFAPVHAELGAKMATAVAAHATPVGSGTVARTERIPVEERAAAAVIAWMRHQTTAYDNMKIERVKGRRREVRRELAQQSKALLAAYRAGRAVEPANCPLQRAMAKSTASPQGGAPR